MDLVMKTFFENKTSGFFSDSQAVGSSVSFYDASYVLFSIVITFCVYLDKQSRLMLVCCSY